MSGLRTCGALLSERARARGKDPFYVIGDKSVTYAEVDRNSNRVANGLQGLGVKKGDRVCGLFKNSIEHIYSWFAVNKLGAPLVPINTQIQEDQIVHIINNSETEILLVEAEFLRQIDTIKGRIPRIRTLVIAGEAAAPAGIAWNIVPFEKLLESSPEAPDVTVSNTDLAALLYTSGTTGPPKGVMLSHEYYIAGGELMTEKMKETETDVFYTTLPFYHIMGQIHGVQTPLQAGGKAYLAERFSVSRFWDDMRKSGGTVCCLTGTQCNFLFQQAPKPDDTRHSLRLIMAFPLPGEIANEFEKRFNLKLRSIYGLTEALLPILAPVDGPYKVGSLGKATDYDVRIADDSDNELPPNEPGNLLVRPIKVSRRVLDGYYKMPEATAEILKHTWFHTGDMGYKDEDGFIWFASRKKDVIRFRGENISAAQVESIIGSHAKVMECAVIGVPSQVGEEDVKALICLKEGQALKPEEFMDYCEDKMTWFMIPRYVEFVTSLPKTATDKVEKFKLKANWKTPATWDREAAGYKLKKKPK